MDYPPVAPEDGSNFCKITHSETYGDINPASKSDCQGKYILITGGARGIGQSTAVAFAMAGAKGIGLADIAPLEDTERQIQDATNALTTRPQILKITMDVTDRASINAAKSQVEEHFGRLDILINNAGYLSPYVPLLETNEEQYWSTFEINIRGVYWVTKTMLPLILGTENGLKTIINLSSVAGHKMTKGASGYAACYYEIRHDEIY